MEWVVPGWAVVVVALAGFIGLIVAMNVVMDRGAIWWGQIRAKWRDGDWTAPSDPKRSSIGTPIRIAIIFALALIASVWLVMYMSPYQSCVRELAKTPVGIEKPHLPTLSCADRFGKKK